MKVLLQRVKQAKVEVGQAVVGEIEQGLLCFVGVEKGDDEASAEKAAKRLLGYRVFADQDDKMNCSVTDINAALLLVSQFTLAADTGKGRRPSFSTAAPPPEGERLFNHLVHCCQASGLQVATGEFGANMAVSLVNDGPVTFLLET